MKREFSRHILEKCSNIKFHSNPSNGSRVIPCGDTDEQTDGLTDRRSDKTKLKVAFRNFANAPRNVKMLIGNHFGKLLCRL